MILGEVIQIFQICLNKVLECNLIKCRQIILTEWITHYILTKIICNMNILTLLQISHHNNFISKDLFQNLLQSSLPHNKSNKLSQPPTK